MMSTLKKYAGGWVAQILLVLLVLSFAVWGVADIFTGFGSTSVARVGSQEVGVADFERDYNVTIQNLSRQYGTPITQEQARLLGIPGQVLGRLVNQATLDNAAQNLQLGISDARLGQEIASDPQFFGSAGVYDRNVLAATLRAQGMTEDQFILLRRKEYERSQLAQAIAGGVKAPNTLLAALHEFRSEERDVSYLVLSAEPETTIAEPDETQLAAFYEERKEEWRAPELRSISYFVVSAESLAKPDEVSDADAQARYDASIERFTTHERRKVEQIVFPDRATAEAAAESIASGKTFEDIMAERSMTAADVDLGTVSRQGLIDPAIAEAAFALEENAVSQLVEGRFGPVLLRVTSIEPGTTTPFEKVSDQLKQEIAQERAMSEMNDIRDAIEDARAGGETLEEIAQKYGLEVRQQQDVDARGADIDGNVVSGVPAGMVAAAFESDVGLDNDYLQPDRSSYVWFEVTALAEPRERALDEVRDRVISAWRTTERQKRLADKGLEIAERLRNGESISSLALELGATRRTAAALTRLGTPSAEFSATTVEQIFERPVGAVDVATGSDPLTAVVFKIDSVNVPEFVADEDTEQQISSQYIGNLLSHYVTEVQSRTNVTLNQAALQQLLGTATAN